MSRLDLMLEPKPAEVRRIEVITGGKRRRWSHAEKARAVEASLEPGAVVSVVARQHGATPQQLFTWRREARRTAHEGVEAESFVPVVVETVRSACAAAPAFDRTGRRGDERLHLARRGADDGERHHRRAEGG